MDAAGADRPGATGCGGLPRGLLRRPTTVEFREVRGRDDLWVAEVSISYDQGPWSFGVSILEFRGNKIARESIYVTEGWQPPEWRAQWRSVP